VLSFIGSYEYPSGSRGGRGRVSRLYRMGFEESNEFLVSVKVDGLFDQLNAYNFLKDSAVWSDVCISYVTNHLWEMFEKCYRSSV
jgi:hypothetical protein